MLIATGRDPVKSFTAGRYIAVLAGLALIAPAASAAVGTEADNSNAKAAGTQSLSISGTLRITKAAGFVVEASGPVTGTLHGTLSARFLLLGTSRIKVTFTGYPKGGSISGGGTGTYHIAGPVATFRGVATLTGGSGTYAHASGSGIQATGTLNRAKKVATVRVTGTFHP
jgi:hypothetical protein